MAADVNPNLYMQVGATLQGLGPTLPGKMLHTGEALQKVWCSTPL